jgi:hypothetical protein
MSAVKTLCSKGIVLSNGRVSNIDEIEESVHFYLKNNSIIAINEWENSNIKINKIGFRKNSIEVSILEAFSTIELDLEFEVKKITVKDSTD